MRLSLRRTLASHMTAFAVLPALAGGLIIALGGGWFIQAEVFDRMQSIADATCEKLQLICTDLTGDLDRFAQRGLFRQAAAVLADPSASPSERRAQQHTMGDQLGQLISSTEHLGGAAVIVSLRTGQAVAWAGCSESHARVIVAEHVPHSELAAPEAWLSPAHRDHTTSLPVIAVIQALPLPEGRSGPPVAAVIHHVPLAYRVYPAIEERSHIGRTGEIVFVDQTGLALHDVRYEPGSAFRKVIRARPARAATAGARGVRVTRDYRGVFVVAGVGKVPVTGWGIVAKENAVEAYAHLLPLVGLWLALVAFLVPVAMVTARRLSARFLAPIEELALATHRVAQGDLDTPVPEHRDDEPGALVADFNLMAVQVASAQHALQQSEEAFRSLFEQAAVGVAQVGLDGRWLRVNQRLCDIVGYTEQELLARTFQDITHPDDLDADLEYVRQLVAGEIATYSMEKRYFRKDGSVVWINLTVNLVRTEAGEPWYFVSVVEDISERHAAAEALAASEDRYRSLFEGMIEGYAHCQIIRDDEGRAVDFVYLEVNPAFGELTTWENVVGKRETEVMPAGHEAPPELFERYGRVAATGEPDAWEFYFPPNDRWFAVGVYSTEPERFVIVFQNITARKHAEASLRESEARYRTIGEVMPHGTFMADRDGRQVYLSPSFLDLIGMDMATARQTDWRSLIHPDDREASRRAWQVATAGRSFFTNEYRIRGRDGTYHWVLSRGVPLLDETGEVEQWVGVNIDIDDLKAAQALVRESETKYRLLFENMLNGFALHEMIFDDEGRPADYRYLELNAAFEAMTGLTRTAAVGKTVLELLPDLEPEWIETYGQVTLTGEPIRFEQYSAPLGRWFSVLAFRPQPGQFATVVEDITDRRRAEEALAATNARLQAIISASPVAIYMMDREQGVQLWNPAAEELFGWREDEVLGLARPPIVQPEAEEEFARVSRGLLEGRALRGLEAVRPHRDGTLIPVGISAAPLRGADGEVSGWVTVIADLRDRERAEREFEERTALDKLVLVTHGLLQETTPEGLLQRAVDGACELAEAEMGCTAYDYADDRFRVTAIARAASTRSWPEAADLSVEHGGLCLELLHTDAALRLTDEELRRHPAYASLPSEHATLCGLLGVSLTDPAGRPVGVLAVSCRRAGEFTARDESLLQQLATFASLALARLEALRELEVQARALSASNRELEAFSYSVSHDLRAPLRAMDGFSQALLEDYADALDEQGRHYLDRVRGASQRMGELIDDLLQLSRVTRDPMRWEDVDLSALARDIIAQLYAGEPGRSTAATVRDGLSAQGHPALLRALLLNLLGNTWKFTTRRADPRIEFGATEQDGETVYFVRDNGAGFDMRYAERLFTPFQRLHTQEEFPGNGVGLATVQRVVNRHGGRAWAEAAVDQGATFYFTLGQ